MLIMTLVVPVAALMLLLALERVEAVFLDDDRSAPAPDETDETAVRP
jgi:hypothetical protein